MVPEIKWKMLMGSPGKVVCRHTAAFIASHPERRRDWRSTGMQ